MYIIKHCRKSQLYYNEELWIKKGVTGNFDNPKGSSDLAEVSNLVGCLLLYKLNDTIDPGCHGLYRDDWLIIIDDCTTRKGDIIRKKLHGSFNKFVFKLDIQANLKITDYLDVTFNLFDGTVSPFRKKKRSISMLHKCGI